MYFWILPLYFSCVDHMFLYFHGRKNKWSVIKITANTYVPCTLLWSHQFLSQRKLSTHWANEDIASEILREPFNPRKMLSVDQWSAKPGRRFRNQSCGDAFTWGNIFWISCTAPLKANAAQLHHLVVWPSPAWPKPLQSSPFPANFDDWWVYKSQAHPSPAHVTPLPTTAQSHKVTSGLPQLHPFPLLILLSGMKQSNRFPNCNHHYPKYLPLSFRLLFQDLFSRLGIRPVNYCSSEPALTKFLRCVTEDSEKIKAPVFKENLKRKIQGYRGRYIALWHSDKGRTVRA